MHQKLDVKTSSGLHCNITENAGQEMALLVNYCQGNDLADKKKQLKRHASFFIIRHKCLYLTIIPRARMGSESIAHEAEGRMGY